MQEGKLIMLLKKSEGSQIQLPEKYSSDTIYHWDQEISSICHLIDEWKLRTLELGISILRKGRKMHRPF